MTEFSTEQKRCLRRTAWIFAILLAAGPLSFLLLPKVKTRATPPPPRWSTDAFFTGQWTEELRVHLRESSPLTQLLRGLHSEVAHLLGIDEPAVTRGRGGLLFLPVTTRARNPMVEQRGPERRLVFERLAKLAAQRGLKVLVAIAPNKARVHPAAWTEDGELPEARAGEYRLMLDELEAAGLQTVDLATPLVERARSHPGELLFYERDTHWNASGAWLAAAAIAERLGELGWDQELGPRQSQRGEPVRARWVMPDLAERFGVFENGLFGQELGEFMAASVIQTLGEDGQPVMPLEAQPDAPLALCGDSFAGAGLQMALTGAIGRRIDWQGVLPAGGPLRGLVETLGRIERGEIEARVLVWEFVERSGGHGVWESPPAPLDRD